jgi:hypothetical protein
MQTSKKINFKTNKWKTKKNYVGSGKQIEAFEGINISIDLNKIPDDQISFFKDGKYIRLTVAKKKQVDKYGKTHTVWINDYKL